jgi:Cu(I)/Ag(I) efflux system membrane fusion protein
MRISEYEPFIRLGSRHRVNLSPEKVLQEGSLTSFSESETRTAKVRFEILNSHERLKPEMYANVEIKVHLGQKLAVPEGAIIDTGLRQLAIVDKGNGYFEPREVKVGSKVEGYYEVIKGLKAGERVVTSANFLIDSESKLKEAVGGMAGMPGM